MTPASSKREILERVEKWLDAAMAAEGPPEGIDPQLLEETLLRAGGPEGREYDAAAAWSTITALTQEIKLQGRAFKELTEALHAQAGRAAEDSRGPVRDGAREVENRCRREILSALLDLRDGLERGLQTAQAAQVKRPLPHNWLAKLAGPPPETPDETRAALLKGYTLSLERLDAILAGWNVRGIPCQGLLFDPARMNAVDLEETAAAADGTVTEVYRAGYEWNGEVFRTAQVKVARTPVKESKEHV